MFYKMGIGHILLMIMEIEVSLNEKITKGSSWIVDNFYKNPDEIRNFILNQDCFVEDSDPRNSSFRTSKQFLFPNLKKRFENIMNSKITKWSEYSVNGVFQYSFAGTPKFYHCDKMDWVGILYLTPNAPYQCGTTLYSYKKNKVRLYDDDGWNDAWKDLPLESHFDSTHFEPVDIFGNVYNRLVIFSGDCIHSCSEYFGINKENSRLCQLFFFDTK